MVTPRDNISLTVDKLSKCKMYDDFNLHGTERSIFKSLPSLIKAYINVGSKFGDGAVIDYEFKVLEILSLEISFIWEGLISQQPPKIVAPFLTIFFANS